MKRISGKLFSVVFLIGLITVTGVGTVDAAGVTPKENYGLVENCGSDSVVSDTKVTITTISLPAGGVSVAYSQKVQVTDGVTPYSWSISAGWLPAGLFLNANTGEIIGTPTAVGTGKFIAQVTDSQNPAVTVKKTLSITINPPALTIITASFLDGVVRTAYNQKVQATGGFFPYSWSISAGSLPAGLSLNASTGVIIGRPTTAGTSTFTVRVTDSQNPAVSLIRVLSIKIEPSVLPSMWFGPK